MRICRIGNLVCHALAALAFTGALAHSNTAAAANISTAAASIHSTRPIEVTATGGPIVRDEFVKRQFNDSDHQAVFTQPLTSACKAEGCLRRNDVASDTASPATNRTPKFQSPITWQSDFIMAGSRAWTKVIKFTSSGINIRVPLN
jgi:hypothetical protein